MKKTKELANIFTIDTTNQTISYLCALIREDYNSKDEVQIHREELLEVRKQLGEQLLQRGLHEEN